MVNQNDACWLRLLGITSILLKKGIITEQEYKDEMNSVIEGMKQRGNSEEDIQELRKMLVI